MSKTTNPDRKKHDRSRREPKEFAETTLSLDRVTRVVKGGRRMRFRAVVVVGDRKGKVGLGTGKSVEVMTAVQKATVDAKRNMIRVPILKDTIPHEVNHKFKAARLRILPASAGTGLIAGGALRVILEHAGVKNVLSKRYGSNNTLVNAQATMQALQLLANVPLTDLNLDEAPITDAAVLEKEQMKVKTVSKKNIDSDGTLRTDTPSKKPTK